MAVKIAHDAGAPTAAVELMITRPLPDFDLEKVETDTPREVDPLLASQGFKDLLDEARAILEESLAEKGLQIAQLTGAICHDRGKFRPGLWLVLRESGTGSGVMTAGARSHVETLAELLRSRLGLG